MVINYLAMRHSKEEEEEERNTEFTLERFLGSTTTVSCYIYPKQVKILCEYILIPTANIL